MTEVVTVRAAVRTYGTGHRSVRALQDVDVTLNRGELLALVGPSGSGKSTLLHALAGWETLDRGTITWTDTMDAPDRWQSVAVVPQRLGLINELDLRENLLLPLRLGSRSANHDAVDEVAAALGLGALLDRNTDELSLGEQQRAAVARALIVSPRVVLADEPTGHQDEESTTLVVDALCRAATHGTSILVCTHDPAVIESADRIIEMADGRLVDDPG